MSTASSGAGDEGGDGDGGSDSDRDGGLRKGEELAELYCKIWHVAASSLRGLSSTWMDPPRGTGADACGRVGRMSGCTGAQAVRSSPGGALMEASSTQRRRALLHLGAPTGCTNSVSETVIDVGRQHETRSPGKLQTAPEIALPESGRQRALSWTSESESTSESTRRQIPKVRCNRVNLHPRCVTAVQL